ncbi:MAG: hypothetical protein ACOZHQ_04085 [Thermodesulfobacteriota bacterium]
MNKSEMEINFENYRQALREEAARLTSYIAVYRKLIELQQTRIDEMNIAPAFFQIVIDSLHSSIIIWSEKLLNKNSQRGLYNFLTFCGNNLNLFSISELQRRREYPDDHWMLDREPITIEDVNNDKQRIANLAALKYLKLRRDKVHAHFDKEYFFNKIKISIDAPIKWSDLTEIIQVMEETINLYSSSYDGNLFSLHAINNTDIELLLDRLHSASEQ